MYYGKEKRNIKILYQTSEEIEYIWLNHMAFFFFLHDMMIYSLQK